MFCSFEWGKFYNRIVENTTAGFKFVPISFVATGLYKLVDFIVFILVLDLVIGSCILISLKQLSQGGLNITVPNCQLP